MGGCFRVSSASEGFWTMMPKRIERVMILCRAHRRGVVLAAGALVLVLAVASSVLFWSTEEWRTYVLDGTLLTLDLPAVPTATPAGLQGEAGVLHEARCQEVAMVASGGPLSPEGAADVEFMVAQAMRYVGTVPGVADLAYRMGRERLNGQPCTLVAGTFTRNGVPARLTGAFFFTPSAHSHVICFWSDPKGARKASRILRSVKVSK